MKAKRLFPFLVLPVALLAQDLSPKEHDPVLHSLADEGSGPVVTVDLRDSADEPEAAAPSAEKEAPVLVTGRPPADAQLLEVPETPLSEMAPPETEGVAVRVEPGAAGAAVRPLPASEVKLLAPFPAKLLAAAPAGWRLDHPESAPPFVREVDLANGTRISLTIRPHVLVPDADGAHRFAVEEPGYDPAQQYAQTRTVGAILTDSIQRLEDDSRQLDDALGRLGQLLDSLPTPAPAAPPKTADSHTPPRATLVK